MSALAPTLEAFFTDRLMRQRQASPSTIGAYRDTMRLLLGFVAEHTATEPSKLDLGQLDAPLIGAFLDHLEQDRGCGPRTRNARLAALRSFYRYAALQHPEHAATIARVLAIEPKRYQTNLVTYLDEEELDALLDAPNRSTWTGRRDHAILVLAAQTGLRASELVGLACSDVHLGTGAHVRCVGKRRKERVTPLIGQTIAVLDAWLSERAGDTIEPLFPTSTGRPLTRDALERRLTRHHATAAAHCPSLRTKRVTPHVLRHTAAMRLLHAGVDTTVIAMWLGHEKVETTQVYIHADMTVKEHAIAKTKPLNGKPGRYQPPDALLAFLEGL